MQVRISQERAHCSLLICPSNANAYNLVNGQLFVTNSGVTQQFSTNTGVAYQAFLPSSSVGNVTTTFSLTAGSALLWTNSSFYAGNAQFCIMPSGVINAVFQYEQEPTGCVFISLTISDITNCVNPQGPTGVSRCYISWWTFSTDSLCLLQPSGPQGIQGISGLSGQAGVRKSILVSMADVVQY